MGQSDSNEPSRILLWLLVALILAFAILAVILSLATGWTGTGMMGMGVGWMAVFMAIPAIVIVLILLAVLGFFDRTYPAGSVALDTLELRLARGEITPEEFRSLKEQLTR